MEKVNVLVTGNEGYIGSVVTAHLIAQGHQVTGLDNGLFRDVSFVPRTASPQRQIYKDIRDVQASDLKDIDAIIHLAGLCNDSLGQLDPALTDAINHVATVNLAKHAKAAGVQRFLFSSSCSMYGASNEALVDEQAPFLPQTAYAKSKVDAEYGLHQLADKKFTPIFLRNATVFGISPRLRLDLVVQDLLARGLLTNVVQLLSDGTPWRPLVHIDDVASAFSFLLQQPQSVVHNQAFNIGREDNNVQIKDIAEEIVNLIPGSHLSISKQANPDTRSYRVSFKKVESVGWKATHALKDELTKIYQIYKDVNFSEKDSTSDRYITLKRYANAQAAGTLDKNLRVV